MGLAALMFSVSLLATPQATGWLLECDWSAVSDQLPPLLEEEVQHEAVPQSGSHSDAFVGAPDAAHNLPRPSDDSWQNAVQGNVTVPPPEVC